MFSLHVKVTVLVFSENRSSQYKRKKKSKLNAKKFLTQGLRKLEHITKNLYIYVNGI